MTTDKETPYWEQDIAECLRVAAEIIGPNSYYLRAAEYIDEIRAERDRLLAVNVSLVAALGAVLFEIDCLIEEKTIPSTAKNHNAIVAAHSAIALAEQAGKGQS